MTNIPILTTPMIQLISGAKINRKKSRKRFVSVSMIKKEILFQMRDGGVHHGMFLLA